jgi:hypothetical protein
MNKKEGNIKKQFLDQKQYIVRNMFELMKKSLKNNLSTFENTDELFTIILIPNLFTNICIFLIYGNLDFLFYEAKRIGNLAYTGIFLDLINHRNLMYVYFGILCILYYFNFNRFLQLFTLALLLFTFYRFVSLIKKYKQILN